MLISSLLLLTVLFSSVRAQQASNNGRCGTQFGMTCAGTTYGQCCSSSGWCGTGTDYCGSGCQSGYGTCSAPASTTSSAPKPISTDTRCGSKFGGQTCLGSAGGQCCSIYGYCGSGSDYCWVDRCQSDYGVCNNNPPPPMAQSPSGQWQACPASMSTVTVAQSASTVTVAQSASTRIITSVLISTSISTLTSTSTTTSTTISTTTSTSLSVATSISTYVQTSVSTTTTTSTVSPPPVSSATTVTINALPLTITTTLVPPAITVAGLAAVTITSVSISVSIPPAITIAITTTLPPLAATVTQSFTTTTTTTTTTTAGALTSAASTVTVTTTTTAIATVTTNPALLNVGVGATATAITATTTITTTATVQSTYTCPTSQPVGNPSFEPNNLSPWIPLSAGLVSSGRTTGGSGLSAYAYKFTLDATNPNLPQRLIQPLSLCPGSTYSLAFNARQSIATGSVSIVGSVQVGNSSLVQLAGGTVTGGTFYAAAGSLGNLVVGAGAAPVGAVLVIEATFGPAGTAGAKEAYIDEVYLNKV